MFPSLEEVKPNDASLLVKDLPAIPFNFRRMFRRGGKIIVTPSIFTPYNYIEGIARIDRILSPIYFHFTRAGIA